MKPFFEKIAPYILQIIVIGLIVMAYWLSTQFSPNPQGQGLFLLEVAQESSAQAGLFHSTHNGMATLPISPLLTLILTSLFKIFGTSTHLTGILSLGIATGSLVVCYLMGCYLFRSDISLICTGLLTTAWGFFLSSHWVDGAMLYLLLIGAVSTLFLHWINATYRSRTYAKGLFIHFILLGALLAFCLATLGLPGMLFPCVLILSSIVLLNRIEHALDIPFRWIGIPFLAITVLWFGFNLITVGLMPFIKSLWPFQLYSGSFTLPLTYMLPILPFFIPALLSKETRHRALLSYKTGVSFLILWLFWSILFGAVSLPLAHVFSLLLSIPIIFWVGFYFSEVFRSPVIPKLLQLTMDTLILLSFAVGIGLVFLAFQIAPSDHPQWHDHIGMHLYCGCHHFGRSTSPNHQSHAPTLSHSLWFTPMCCDSANIFALSSV